MTVPLLPLLAQTPVSGDLARDLLIVLATAGVTVLVLGWLRVSAIPGYLIAGAIIGPHALGLIASPETVQSISRLSTILLMFIIGLHMDMARVRSGLFSIVGCAIGATAIMVVLGWPIAYALIGRAPAALVVAMAVSCAATAAPLRLMESRRELNTIYGRLAFGITFFQDLLAVAMLALLPALSLWAGVRGGEALGGEEGWAGVARTSAIALGGLVLLVLAGRYLMPRVIAAAGRVSGEVLIVISIALGLGAGVFTAALGFSPELGGFLAGFLLASTPFRPQIAGQLAPMLDLFLAMFFTSIGLAMPLAAVAGGWWIVLVALGALGVLKIVSITASAWAFGATARFGLLAAVLIMPAGEFTLVMLSQGRSAGLLTETEAGYGIALVVVSILVAPWVVRGGFASAHVLDRVPRAPWLRASPLRGEDREPAAEQPEGVPPFRAIVAGFGPVGRAVADTLEKNGTLVTVVELNARTVERQTGLGRTIVYGDASNAEVLESAGLATADAVILTMPDEEAMLRACRAVRALRPDIFIAARANVLSRALQAMQLGADHAVAEEMVTAEAMAAQVLIKVRQRIAGEDTGPKLYQFSESGRA